MAEEQIQEYHAINIHDVNDYLSNDDKDRKGIEKILSLMGQTHCGRNKNCHMYLLVLDTFFDYYRGNLKDRGINEKAINYYVHHMNNERTLHCYCHDEEEAVKIREARMGCKK